MQAAEGILEGKFDDAGDDDDDDFLEVAGSLQESKKAYKTVCVGFYYFLDSEHRLCSTIRYGSLRCGLIDTGRRR